MWYDLAWWIRVVERAFAEVDVEDRNDMKHELTSVVRAELNHIYTEPPHVVHGGADMGWFCREHAVHVFVLSRLLGHKAEVAVGDFVLALSNGRVFTSADDDSDHAWCVVDGVSPVDASVSTRHVNPEEPEIGLVYGTEPTAGGYAISCHAAGDVAAAKRAAADHRPAVAYIENRKVALDPITLLASPFEFLLPPPLGCPSFTDIHGDDVFFQITWHCFRLATGAAKPFYPYRDPKQTVRGAIKFNPDARTRIEERLGN